MGISRVDYPQRHTVGYYVRIRRNGTGYSQFFSDKAYGTKKKAEKAAKDYEKVLLAWLDEHAKPRKVKPGPRNTSGVLGVCRTVMKSGSNLTEYWQANWKDVDGRRRSAKFSVTKFGEKDARKMALKARKTGMESSAKS